MEKSSINGTYIYQINADDKITFLSDNWEVFTKSIIAGKLTSPDKIIGTSLWDHIHGLETEYLHEMIINKVRETEKEVTFPCRCDSPEDRLFSELSVIPLSDGNVEFRSILIRIESRTPVEILKIDTERSDDLVRICSMCKKIAVSDTRWQEIESAVNSLNLFNKSPLPQLTHGICPACYTDVRAELDKMNVNR